MWNCYYANDPYRQVFCPRVRDESAPCKTCEKLEKRELFEDRWFFWCRWFKGGIILQHCRTIITFFVLAFFSVVLGIIVGQIVGYPDPTKSDVPFWVFAYLSATIGVFLAIVFTAFIFMRQNFSIRFNDLVRDYRNNLNEILPGRGGHFEHGDILTIIDVFTPDKTDATVKVEPIYADFKFLLDEHKFSSKIMKRATYRFFILLIIVLIYLPLGEAPLEIKSNLLLSIWWSWMYFPIILTLYTIGDLISSLHSYLDV